MTTPSDLTQVPTSATSETPSGTTPLAAPTAAGEFRFGPDAEPWMQGKTPAEVTALAKQLASLAAQAVQQQPAYQPQAQPQANQPPTQEFDPNDLVSYGALQQRGQQFVQQAGQYAQQAVAPAIQMAASTNFTMIKQKYPKEFQKYGPEILTKINAVPKDQWTIDNLETLVQLALVPHLKDLVEDGVSTRLAADPALRSSGANGLSSSQPTPGPEASLTDAQRAHLRRQGMTPALIAEHAAKFGMPLEKWYANFAKNSVGDA